VHNIAGQEVEFRAVLIFDHSSNNQLLICNHSSEIVVVVLP